MNEMLVVGIAGGSGSGKTTLTKRLAACFPQQVSVLYHDNYYKAHPNMPPEERAALNYDHPDAFDTELLCRQVRMLREGKPVACPTYDYALHDRSKTTIAIEPRPVLLIDGILVLAVPALRDLMDIRIFVDTDADERILRRILRDVEERGRSVRSVTEQYLATVKPMHNLFVEPSKRFADIVIPEGGMNRVAADMLIKRIESHIAKEKNHASR